MGTLHGWGQSQLNKGREECQLFHLCFSKGSVTLNPPQHCLYVPHSQDKQPLAGLLLLSCRNTGTLNQEQRAFPPFTEEQGLKNHSPRNSWKDFLERCRNEIQESFQEDTWPLQAFLGHTPWLVWIAVTTQSFTCFCWTNPEFPPWPVPKYIYIHLRPCTTPLLSHIPFAPAAKGSAPATRCQQHSSDLQSFPNQLPCNVQLPLFITPTNSNATHQGPQINSSTAMQYLST